MTVIDGRRRFILRIENYLPLIIKISNQHWKRLPEQTRSWVDEKDFQQEGVIFAQAELMPHFEFSKQVKFSTYLFTSLNRFYSGYRESLTCEKRFQTAQVVAWMYDQQLGRQEVEVRGINAYHTLQTIYDKSSTELQDCMEEWFFSRTGAPKIVTTSAKFKRVRREFLKLSRKYGIDESTCRDLLVAQRAGVFSNIYQAR